MIESIVLINNIHMILIANQYRYNGIVLNIHKHFFVGNHISNLLYFYFE